MTEPDEDPTPAITPIPDPPRDPVSTWYELKSWT